MLYLYHVEAVSLVIIALMTELSISVVRRVAHKKRRQDVPAAEKATALHPSSKGRIERQIHCIRDDNLLVSKTAAPSTPPPGRRHRRERHDDRT